MISRFTCITGLLLFLFIRDSRAQAAGNFTIGSLTYNSIVGSGGSGSIDSAANIVDTDPNNFATISVTNTSDQYGADALLNDPPGTYFTGVYYVGFYISSVSDPTALESAVLLNSENYTTSYTPVENSFNNGLGFDFVLNGSTYSGNVWFATTAGNSFNALEITLEGDLIPGSLSGVQVNYGFVMNSVPGSNPPYSFPLPVRLTNFSVSLDAKEMPQLNWSTSSELNAAHFEVDRSSDGYHFNPIGQVAAHGTSPVPHDYVFTDALANSGVNYYRLRTVDFDGQFNFSKIVSISLTDQGQGLLVFPNPVHYSANLQFKVLTTGNYRLDLVNMSGQVVNSRLVNIASQQQTMTYTPGTALPPGIYILHAVNIFTGESYVKKILLQ